MADAIDIAAAERQLDAFLVDNDDLEALNARLAKFNLFRTLRIERAEIRHSNVLAWLLTPQETHGLGDRFLRRFLSTLLMENEDVEVSLRPADVELMRLDDIEVLREWQNIDILVRSEGGAWCLLIENKVGSKESADQLLKYIAVVKREMPKCQVIPALLTLEGEEPSEAGQKAGYVPLSHQHVLEIAARLVEQHRSRIPDDAAVFLDHYLGTLRRLTMQDEELVKLCKRIYRKHREAIDLITEYGVSSQVLDACEAKLQELVKTDFVQHARSYLWFVPSEMAAALSEVKLLGGWSFLTKQYPIVWFCCFNKKTGRLHLIMEVGPMADSANRIALLKALARAGFSIKEKAFDEDTKFTRVVSESRKLRLTEDGAVDDSSEYIQGTVEALWNKAWSEGKKIVEALKTFDWQAVDT